LKPINNTGLPFDRDNNSPNDYYFKKLKEFKSLSHKEKLEIRPLWNLNNKRVTRGLDFYNLKEYKLSKLINHIVFNASKEFDNEPKVNKGVMNILIAWKNKVAIDPPTITVDNGISIFDGNHRILAAYFMNVKSIFVYEKE
jgi:hypothetical protein